MPGCPACGTEVAQGASECPRCHLAVHLFEAVREAVGLPEDDPKYAKELRDLLEAVDPGGVDLPKTPGPPSGRIAYPSRFPAPAPPTGRYPEGPTAPALERLPALPALPDGGVPALRRQLDDYLHLARRQGIDVTGIEERLHPAIAADDAESLESILRELFVRIAASLSQTYEETATQRNGIATLISTELPNERLEKSRAALEKGDLTGAERWLRDARAELAGLDEEWSTVQILLTECDLLAETVRELGGDPGPALGPLDEGRRIARTGRRADAEPVLARAALALWAILNPRLGPEMHRVKDALLAKRLAGGDVGPALEQFRAMTLHLRARNFGAAVANYRNLRTLVELSTPSGATGGPAPATVGDRPTPAPS